MKVFLLFTIVTLTLFADNLNLFEKNKKELREYEKKILKQKYNSSKKDWIGGVDLSSSLNRSHSFSSENDKFSKSISIGFSQSIYKSGGIKFSIKNAKDSYNEDLIAWENENITILKTIYETLLEIKKIKLQIEQSDFSLKNKEIELILKRIQYEAGKVDIVELNNAIMAKNTQYKTNISLQNSLKDMEYELSKYTNYKYEEIEILDFKPISKEVFLKNSIDLRYENSKIKTLESSHEELKSSYLPELSVSTNLSYTNTDDLTKDINDDSTGGSIALKLSMPLFDATKKYKLEEKRLEVLKQKINVNDLKKELAYKYEQILTQLDTFEKYEKTIKENLLLYKDLILVNATSNSAGMSSDYDLDILKNTEKINEYDLKINEINMKLEYSKLYFMTKVES